jgi:hypothetical protein
MRKNCVIRWLKRETLLKILSIMMILSLMFSGYTIYRVFTLKPGQAVTISGGTKVEKPVTNITNAQIDKDGNLVLTYSDGEARNVGSIVGSNGKDGADGKTPTNSEIALAIKTYCLTNKCSENPTSAQVMSAVAAYCSGGICNGTNGKNASDEQIATAVAKYCAAGRCKGDTGATGAAGANGTNGVDGKDGRDGKDGASPQLSCVNTKDNSGNQTSWVAWKYDGEANTAYRRLYKIDGDSNCINI